MSIDIDRLMNEPAWPDGGLPPVGTHCEVLVHDLWTPATITGVGRQYVLLWKDGHDRETIIVASPARFRPLPTAR